MCLLPGDAPIAPAGTWLFEARAGRAVGYGPAAAFRPDRPELGQVLVVFAGPAGAAVEGQHQIYLDAECTQGVFDGVPDVGTPVPFTSGDGFPGFGGSLAIGLGRADSCPQPGYPDTGGCPALLNRDLFLTDGRALRRVTRDCVSQLLSGFPGNTTALSDGEQVAWGGLRSVGPYPAAGSLDTRCGVFLGADPVVEEPAATVGPLCAQLRDFRDGTILLNYAVGGKLVAGVSRAGGPPSPLPLTAEEAPDPPGAPADLWLLRGGLVLVRGTLPSGDVRWVLIDRDLRRHVLHEGAWSEVAVGGTGALAAAELARASDSSGALAWIRYPNGPLPDRWPELHLWKDGADTALPTPPLAYAQSAVMGADDRIAFLGTAPTWRRPTTGTSTSTATTS